MERRDDRLVDYPYVVVRLGCDLCLRRGQYRLARLAATFGAEIGLEPLLMRLSADCPWRDGEGARGKRRTEGCQARFVDLGWSRPPPDLPPGAAPLRLVTGSRKDAAE
jgi:hypothetical protein